MFEQIRLEFQSQFIEIYNSLITILPDILMVILVLFLFWVISKFIRWVIKERVSRLLKDPVLTGFSIKVLHYTLLIIAISISLKILGLNAIIVGIFSGAGVMAIIFGFAFKDIGENFIAGMILAFNRPFKKGDLIMINDQKGRVNRMTIRETQIKTFDGKDVFIPNASILKGNLINYTVDGYLRYQIEISIEEGSNIEQAFQVILKTLNNMEGVLNIPPPNVLVTAFGSSTFILNFNFWIDLFDENTSRLKVRSQAHILVWQALTDAGFNLPGDVYELKTFADKDFPIDQRSKQAS